MDVRSVDERDVQSESDHPVFRVYVWRPTVDPALHPVVGWANYSYEMSACDVHEAIAWAEEQLQGEHDRYTLYVCYRRLDGVLATIKIAGKDPTHPDE